MAAVSRDVARILSAKPPYERLRLAHEAWELARDRLGAFMAARHPEWDAVTVRRAVAQRLLGDAG
ncbi:MAG: hypothetical protein HYU41_19175 [Candidatus Rokubacteria bacterium]|nr:hypothetical protein [Candidatus Rokubacteria bacterium]